MLNFNFMGKSGYYVDMCYDDFNDELIFVSLYNYTSQIDKFVKSCKQRQTLESTRWNKKIIKDIDNYYVERAVDNATGLCHLVLLKKEVLDTETKTFDFYLASMGAPSSAQFFNKINSFTGIPLKEEWQDYLMQHLMDAHQITRCSVDYYGGDKSIELWHCSSTDAQLLQLVSTGLEQHELFIDANKATSKLDRETKLDAYLTQASEHLTTRIQEKFTPRFDPNHAHYTKPILDFEDWCWNDGAGIQLFDAQKSVIAAGAECLAKEHRTFIVGEMGTGMQYKCIN